MVGAYDSVTDGLLRPQPVALGHQLYPVAAGFVEHLEGQHRLKDVARLAEAGDSALDSAKGQPAILRVNEVLDDTVMYLPQNSRHKHVNLLLQDIFAQVSKVPGEDCIDLGDDPDELVGGGGNDERGLTGLEEVAPLDSRFQVVLLGVD